MVSVFNACAKCWCYRSGECEGAPFSPVMRVSDSLDCLLGSAECRRRRFNVRSDGLELRISQPYTIPWSWIDTREAAGVMCDRLLEKRWFMVEDRIAFMRTVYEHFGWSGPAVILVELGPEREVCHG